MGFLLTLASTLPHVGVDDLLAIATVVLFAWATFI